MHDIDLIDGYKEGVHWIDKDLNIHIIKDMPTDYLENILELFKDSNIYGNAFKRNVKYVAMEIRNRKLKELIK